MDINKFDNSKWGKIFILLSMDRVVNFYEELGILFVDKVEFVELMRGLIMENRREYKMNPGVIPNIGKKVFEQVERQFGQTIADKLYKWTTTVYIEIHSDLPQWSAWKLLFLHFVYVNKVKNRLKTDLLDWKEIFSNYRTLTDSTVFEQKMKTVVKSKLSKWDTEMYVRHNFTEGESNNPLLSVETIIEMNAFQIFWEDMLQKTNMEQKDILYNFGKILIKELKIWMPEATFLCHPQKLRRLI